jgi:GT2 family glycosyltransferase
LKDITSRGSERLHDPKRSSRYISTFRIGHLYHSREAPPLFVAMFTMTKSSHPNDGPLPEDTPLVSVVVPACNNEGPLPLCLQSLLEQSWHNLEILVVDDCSEDGTAAVLGDFAQNDSRVVPLATPSRLGAAGARNVALRQATGEILVFLDADMSAPPNWVETLIAPILSVEAQVTGAPDYVPADAPVVSRCLGYAMDNPVFTGGLRSGSTQMVKYLPGTGNLALTREVLEATGLFNEDFHDYGEDKEFLYRVQEAGWVIRYVHEAFAWHHRAPDLGSHMRKQFLSGMRRVDIWRCRPSTFEWPHVAPAMGVVAFLSALLVPSLWPAAGVLRTLALGALALGLVFDGLMAWRRLSDVRALVLAPLASAAIPYGYGAGTLYRALQLLFRGGTGSRHPNH